jgi:hypothetical protein
LGACAQITLNFQNFGACAQIARAQFKIVVTRSLNALKECQAHTQTLLYEVLHQR